MVFPDSTLVNGQLELLSPLKLEIDSAIVRMEEQSMLRHLRVCSHMYCSYWLDPDLWSKPFPPSCSSIEVGVRVHVIDRRREVASDAPATIYG